MSGKRIALIVGLCLAAPCVFTAILSLVWLAAAR